MSPVIPYWPLVGIDYPEMTMLVAGYNAARDYDLLIATDGCRSVKRGGEWFEEESWEIKSFRLSSQCAVAIAGGSLRFINHLLGHIFKADLLSRLPGSDSAGRLILEREHEYMREHFALEDLGQRLCCFRLPVPIKEEIGAGVTVLGVGIRKDGSSGIEQWRFTQASMAHRHDPVPIVYSVLERGDEDSCMINYLTKSKDLEKNIQAAFSYAAEKHPGRINANVVIRSMSEKFKSRWLNSSSAPTP